MKKLIILALLLPMTVLAQNDTTGLPTVDGKIKFVDIQEISTKNKGLLFANAQAFIAQAFKKELNSIQINDPQNAIIAGDLTLGSIKNPGMKFTYTITCKDGKYRLEVENLYTFLDLSSMTGHSGSWVPAQNGYNQYLKQKKKGKSLPAYEKTYAKVREIINQSIILPLRNSMTKTNDF